VRLITAARPPAPVIVGWAQMRSERAALRTGPVIPGSGQPLVAYRWEAAVIPATISTSAASRGP
jgi:hypothetical protein